MNGCVLVISLEEATPRFNDAKGTIYFDGSYAC
jgi:hypothetical protein